VFAVPGAPSDPRSSGGNDLIRQGAILTESANDVLGVVNGLERSSLEEPQPIDFIHAIPISVDAAEVEKARSVIEESLSSAPVTVDEIIRNCQFSPSVVSVVLLDMELAGRLERHPGHQVSLIQGN
jgi:DNA processing protein